MLIVRPRSVDHSELLDGVYRWGERLVVACRPSSSVRGYARAEKAAHCARARRNAAALRLHRMCADCLLCANAMSCSMNLPESASNGPCGGAQADGGCAVLPSMQCMWVEGWHGLGCKVASPVRAALHPPANAPSSGTSVWRRLAHGKLAPPRRVEVPASPSRRAFEQRPMSREFAVAAKFSPLGAPHRGEMHARLAHFRRHVDAINVTDGSGANYRILGLDISAHA